MSDEKRPETDSESKNVPPQPLSPVPASGLSNTIQRPILPPPVSILPPPISATHSSNTFKLLAKNLRSVVAAIVMPLLKVAKWLWMEIREVSKATNVQTVRLIQYGLAVWHQRKLNDAFAAAQFVLGRKMYQAGLGDPQLIDQIATLSKSIEGPSTEQNSLSALRKERRQLTLKLSDYAGKLEGPSTGVEPEHYRAQAAREASQAHRDHLATLQDSLPPRVDIEWWRMGIGYATALLLLLVAITFVTARQKVQLPGPATTSNVDLVAGTDLPLTGPANSLKLQPISAQTVEVGKPLVIVVSVEDAERWKDMLRYSLVAGTPSGATVDPQSGKFSWTPPLDHVAGTETVAVSVEGPGGQKDRISFDIAVTRPSSSGKKELAKNPGKPDHVPGTAPPSNLRTETSTKATATDRKTIDVSVQYATAHHTQELINKLQEAGITLEATGTSFVHDRRLNRRISYVEVHAMPRRSTDRSDEGFAIDVKSADDKHIVVYRSGHTSHKSDVGNTLRVEDCGKDSEAVAAVSGHLRTEQFADHEGFAWKGLAITGQASVVAEVAKILGVSKDKLQREAAVPVKETGDIAKNKAATVTDAKTITAKPESTDDIAMFRVWRDTTEDRSIKATLQSVEADKVVLTKEDNTIATIPRKNLLKDDQEAVHTFVIADSKRELVKAIWAFFATDLGDTAVRIAENQKIAAERLCKRINGRTIQLVFPVQDVIAMQDGKYRLVLLAPDWTGDALRDIEKKRSAKPWDQELWQNLETELAKEEVLKIGRTSVVVMEGKMRLVFSHDWVTLLPRDVLGWRGRTANRSNPVSVTLSLDDRKIEARNQAAKVTSEDDESAGALPKVQ